MEKSLVETGGDDYAAPEDEGLVFMKEIRMAQDLGTHGDIPKGHLYVHDTNTPQGEDPERTDLGTEIEVIFLRDAKRLSCYDEKEDRMIFSSSEFRSWYQQMILFDQRMDDTVILAILPYSDPSGGDCAKDMKDELDFSMRYVTYVLYEDEVYRLNVTVTDYCGTNENYQPRFEAPDEDSLEICKRTCYIDTKGKMFYHKVLLGTKQVETKKGEKWVKTFKVKELIKDKALIEKIVGEKGILDQLYFGLGAILSRKIEKALENTDLSQIRTTNPEYISLIQDDVKPLLNVRGAKYPKLPPAVIDAKQPLPLPKSKRDKEAAKDVEQVVAELEGTAPTDESLTAALTDGSPDVKDLPF